MAIKNRIYLENFEAYLKPKLVLKRSSESKIVSPSSIYRYNKSVWYSWIIDGLANFCRTTNLNGFNQIVRPDMLSMERIFWIVVCFMAILCSMILLSLSFKLNSERKTVTIIESTHAAIWEQPFPSVTICNLNQISQRKATKLVGKLKYSSNFTQTDILKYLKLTLYNIDGANATTQDYLNFQQILDLNGYTLTKLVSEISPDCMSMVQRCMWKGSNTRCDSLFQKVFTSEGVCCSFNYYGMENTSYPRKLEHQIPLEPRRITSCGQDTGLSVLFNVDSDDYFAAYIPAKGIKILLHDSLSFPDPNAHIYFIQQRREVFISVRPESKYSTDDIADLSFKERNCLFSNERKMNAMQYYTYTNCMAECRAEFALTKCGCVPEILPRNDSVPICQIKDAICLLKIQDDIFGAQPGFNLSEQNLFGYSVSKCDCLADCNLYTYEMQVTGAPINREFSYTDIQFFKGITIDDQIIFHVFFIDLKATRYRKSLYQDWLSGLATVGGITGLLMGFSFVSVFELVFYLTLKPIFLQIWPNQFSTSHK